MKVSKKEKLESRGWRVSDAGEFLGLSDDEVAFIEMKLLLSENLHRLRRDRKVSQSELANRMGSSQSRVAKMESGDPSVSVDLLLKGLLSLGATRKEIGGFLGTRRSAA
jgi:DNA-binding XRE family transcriptional regulator